MNDRSGFFTILEALASQASASSSRLYVVGGAVRDLILGSKIQEKDLDFVLEGETRRFAEQISLRLSSFEASTVSYYPQFGTSKITFQGDRLGVDEIDLAAAREEVYAAPGKLPTVSSASIEKDLGRRDFTINAMAIPIEHFARVLEGDLQVRDVLVDYFRGAEDLEHRTVRILHEKSFIDDPTRMFRGCRYVARLRGSFDSLTEALFKAALSEGALKTVSRYRLFSEIRKGFSEGNFKRCLECYQEWGLIESLGLALPTVEVLGILQRVDTYDLFVSSLFNALDESLRSELARDLNISLKKLSKLGGRP